MATFEEIDARLQREHFGHKVFDLGGPPLWIRIPGDAGRDDERICIGPWPENPAHWWVVLFCPTGDVVSELGRVLMSDWPPDEAVEIIREHLAAMRRKREG